MSETKCWEYRIPSIKGEGWGIFLLSSSGMFSAVTDFGNYVYHFGHHGVDDFRKFFKKNHEHYLMNKLCKEVDDEEKTIQNIESRIESQFKKLKTKLKNNPKDVSSEDKERYEHELQTFEALKEEWEEYGFEYATINWFLNTRLDYEHEYIFKKKYQASDIRFFKELYPRFWQVLQDDLKNDEPKTA